MAEFSHIRVDQRDEITVVQLLDSHLVDRFSLIELHDELASLIDESRPHRLLLGFGYVRKFGSEAVNVLLRIHETIKSQDGQVHICDVPNGVREVFKILRLDGTVFHIAGTMAEGLESFG